MSVDDDDNDQHLMVFIRALLDIVGTLERICDRLMRIKRVLENGGVRVPATRQRSRPSASICAFSITAELLPDGSGKVVIDGSRPITLTPLLAGLFAILAADTGESDDGLVGWKTCKQISVRLYEKQGRRVRNDHALHQAVHRLRGTLAARGVNPDIIQFRSGRGYRLAVRRKGSLVSTPVLPAGAVGDSGGDRDHA